MTIRDHPRRIYEAVTFAWADGADGDTFADWTERPGQPLPDIIPGTNNPDDVTTRWEWTTDLTAEEAATWDAMIARLTGGGDGSFPTDEAIDGFETVMKNYRAAGTVTNAQTKTAVDALIDGYRYLRLRSND